MLKADVEACKEIARIIVREEIAKAIAALQKPIAEDPAAAAVKNDPVRRMKNA